MSAVNFDLCDILAEMNRKIEGLEAEIERLREVLLPFAVVAKYVNKHNPDAPDNDEIGGITIGDCRRALAALEPK